MVEGEDYYIEKGYRVLTEAFLLRRGRCCFNGCQHCPYGNAPAGRDRTKPNHVPVDPPADPGSMSR